MHIISFSPLAPGSIGSKDALKSQNQESICRSEPIIEVSVIHVRSGQGRKECQVDRSETDGCRIKRSDE